MNPYTTTIEENGAATSALINWDQSIYMQWFRDEYENFPFAY